MDSSEKCQSGNVPSPPSTSVDRKSLRDKLTALYLEENLKSDKVAGIFII